MFESQLMVVFGSSYDNIVSRKILSGFPLQGKLQNAVICVLVVLEPIKIPIVAQVL